MANCCRCQVGPTPPVCRTVITSADLAELVYAAGLDEDLCEKFQLITDIFQLTDCEGNLIAGSTGIVTCDAFPALLCEEIAALALTGPLVLGVTEVVGVDCTTYTVPETPIIVVDTDSVDLTSSGLFGHTLQADVIISPNAGNGTVILPNGVYTPDLCTAAADAVAGAPVVLNVTELLGADCLTHTVPETPITVTDTASVDLTSSGPFGHDLTADVNLSAFPGNTIVELVDGLYVPAGETVALVVTDTACLNLDVVEAPPGTFTLTGNPIISPNPGNSISCVGNGLFVPASAAVDVIIQAVDNGCIELDAVESPDGVWTITPTLVISPNAGNEASCLDNGLYVPPGSFDLECAAVVASFTEAAGAPPPGTSFLADDCFTYELPTVIAADTPGIDTTVTVIGGDYQVSAVPVIADTYPGFPAGCNPLQLVGDGLTVPPEHTSFNFEVGIASPTAVSPWLENDVAAFADVAVVITNPSACRSMAISIITRIPEVRVDQTFAGGRSRTHVTLDHEFAFPGATPPVVIPTSLKTEWYLASDAPEAGDTAPQRIGNMNPAGSIVNLVILPPGDSGTYTISGVIEQLVGDTFQLTYNDFVVRVLGTTI